MKKVLLGLLLSVAMSSVALADLSATSPDGAVTIQLSESKPCTSKAIKAMVDPARLDEFLKMVKGGYALTPNGKVLACWMINPDNGNVAMIFENGFSTEMPITEFQKSKDL